MQEFERHKRALDLEFRLQRSEAFRIIDAPLRERIEAAKTIAGLVYQGQDGKRSAHHVFATLAGMGRFRANDLALLSPQEPEPVGTTVLQGLPVSIDSVDATRVVLKTHGSDSDRVLCPGLSYVLDERPPTWFPNYQRLSFALALAEYSHSPGERLRKLLAGEAPLTPSQGPFHVPNELTGRMAAGFRLAMESNVAAIQGPPGTGKTFLLARLACEFVRQGLRVVLCCFTHRAINNALQAMVAAGVPLDRLGKVTAQNDPDLPPGIRLLDKQTYWAKPQRAYLAAMTVHAAFEPFATPLYKTAYRLGIPKPEREMLDEEAFWHALDQYNRTIVQSTRLPRPGDLADVVLFDEASQLTIPMALCALAIAPRAVFFGDHAQLPPVNPAAAQFDTHPSIFHLMAERYPTRFARLDETHRMNEELCTFPSRTFYAGDLRSSSTARERRLEITLTDAMYQSVFAPQPASIFVNIDHHGHGQESPLEAALIADFVLSLLVEGGLSPTEGLAVLAPHRRQTNAIREALVLLADARGIARNRTNRILQELVIDTVDRMQGQERDVIIYSLTASDEGTLESEREFLFLPNRFNVAITRARKKLVVVGSRQFFHYLPRMLAHTTWQGPEGNSARRILEEANTFKRWYLEHRATMVDLTDRAKPLATICRERLDS